MEDKSGFLILNKPAGPTSHDMIYKLRRLTGIKKIGHAGTLDPFARGVLIVAVGREATREIGRFVKLDKEYSAVLRLGATTDTYDPTGNITTKPDSEYTKPDSETIKPVMQKFIGKQTQVPPMYSAKKINGKKLYELARKGVEVERAPVAINIYELELSSYDWPLLAIRVKCSSGTYIRALAHDIGQALGCGAYLEELTRTAVGDFQIANAKTLEELEKTGWEKCLFV
ncbi:tRNA pseudouridine(55) synthase TruB [Candidatus Falkowbacteria bacterium RIFOXYB2_FULL_47_14]|uniref:tRNA pseudouridine synthase B n=1 Tax=Candidatus Falkowbacteria bacterium RIFOXYA2_FULL_47_19 TaxID=1797994 RepID=A0A1F5SG36_9BACT|nr:MAG: tRNA pseudouridine(55) synthase TruB [Candidatus Falkowbacteria bacterium RIFOXYA2_FULL_47_19]OGF35505.1 MAG: tRNA pseudouridine(55) synthase TruB [Candidatus Falkowbacteria bacterium RIFOXYC2_FULL_46_15]OGF43585.1 MAG: tRNA pseudouridine(55) synthase TruB [Candidatus Falkowbacteria bacterium RIFOXYB2_FULL_47_14]